MAMHDVAVVRIENGNARVAFEHGQMEVVPRGRINSRSECPVHLLAGALGSCVALTLDAVARNKGIDITGLAIRVEHQRQADGTSRFDLQLEVETPMTERERQILRRSAQLCEVGKILEGQVNIVHHWSENGTDRDSGRLERPEPKDGVKTKPWDSGHD